MPLLRPNWYTFYICKILAVNEGDTSIFFICNIKQSIKKDSYHWYKMMREGQYEYIHEFKERVNEILDLQKKHHQIIRQGTTNGKAVFVS